MAVETEQCPCMWFTLDAGASAPETCYCGDPKRAHIAPHGGCTAQHDINAPYDPALTEAAMRMAKEWLGKSGS